MCEKGYLKQGGGYGADATEIADFNNLGAFDVYYYLRVCTFGV